MLSVLARAFHILTADWKKEFWRILTPDWGAMEFLFNDPNIKYYDVMDV